MGAAEFAGDAEDAEEVPADHPPPEAEVEGEAVVEDEAAAEEARRPTADI